MARTTPLPDHATLVANLRRMRRGATPQQVIEGRSWYPAMGKLIRTIRDEAADETGDYGVTDAQAVGIFAAYSQNATWKANVTMASRYLSGGGKRGMASVLRELDAIEDGADPTNYGVLGLKRADFCANLLGDLSRVTCDRWHLRAAFNSDTPEGLSGEKGKRVHEAVTRATAEVARDFNESPAETQAVIWCAIRGDGK